MLLVAACLWTVSASYAQLFVSTGTEKYVLLEQATGAWAGYCPDGHQNIMQNILPSIPKAVVISYHNSDSMTISGDPFCTGTGYITGFPSATIDRATIGGTVGQNRPWNVAVTTRTTLTPNFKVSMSSTYNPSSRLLTVTVIGEALTTLTGNWNINAVVTEDSISSALYPQSSFLNATTLSSTGMPCWFFGLGTTLASPTVYAHMDVARKILATTGGVWGDAAFTNPISGTTATRTYSYVLPTGYNANMIKVVGMVQKMGATTADRVVENAISSKVRLMPPSSAGSVADSFSVYLSASCTGADFYTSTNAYYASMNVVTEYGDGSTTSNTIVAGGAAAGYATFSHVYAAAGTYTVKHVLRNGTVRLDSTSYSYEYRLCNDLFARFYVDGNSNCVYETGSTDIPISSAITVAVDSNGTAVDTISCLSGLYYKAYGNPGDVYRFRVLSSPGGLTLACPSGGMLYDTLTATAGILPANDFGYVCSSPTGFDLQLNSSTRAFTNRCLSQVVVSNTSCAPTSGVLTMNFSPRYVYSSASVPPTSVVGNTVTWNISALSFLTPNAVINVTLVHGPAGFLPTFDTVHTQFFISPLGGDSDTMNNKTYEIDSAIGSYDPNYVEANPSYCIPTSVSEIEYTVGFENMGGDTAHNIYVLDTIAPNLNFATLKPISATHNMNVLKYTSGGHNIVKFDFPNIMLPDSSHHDVCHGMFRYTIDTYGPMSYGTTIACRVGIYFDANPPVMTNTATNLVCFPASVPTVPTVGVEIFPNPATDQLYIRSNSEQLSGVTITNSVGQVMLQQATSGALTTLNVAGLPSGIYIVILRGERGNSMHKFVKQ